MSAGRPSLNGWRAPLRSALRWLALLLLFAACHRWLGRQLYQVDIIAVLLGGQWRWAGVALAVVTLRLLLVVVIPGWAAARLGGAALVWLMERKSRDAQ